jgi:hypothetical protein
MEIPLSLFWNWCFNINGQDSVFGIAISHGLEDSEIESRRERVFRWRSELTRNQLSLLYNWYPYWVKEVGVLC